MWEALDPASHSPEADIGKARSAVWQQATARGISPTGFAQIAAAAAWRSTTGRDSRPDSHLYY
jgi:hypothetical protein